jgi:hypothetical protein
VGERNEKLKTAVSEAPGVFNAMSQLHHQMT